MSETETAPEKASEKAPESAPKRRRWPKIVAIILGGVAVLIIGLVAVVVSTVKDSLPALDGEVIAPVSAKVTIERDALGIPTITASSRVDVAYATGFLHGQERFFQMDLTRRAAAGELSALFGAAAVNFDKSRRIHRTRHTARAVIEGMSARHRALLDAYVKGANDGLTALDSRPFEYQLLGQTPAPWIAEDTALVIIAMFFDLQDETAERERMRAALFDAVPDQMAEWLTPRGNARWGAPIDGSPVPIVPAPAADVIDIRSHEAWAELKADEQARAPTALGLPVIGSNSWAVAGHRSHHGGAIVADDMHLGLRIPIIWYRAAWQWTESGQTHRMEGVTLPGGPVVVVGSNGKVAWAFTNSQIDTVDAVRLELDGDGYRTPEGTEPFVEHTETIDVSGGDAVSFTHKWTRWGPVIDGETDRPMAAQWIGHDPTAIDLSVLDLESVDDIDGAMDVANAGGVPPQNFVVGDHTGRIAWSLFGYVPLRVGYDGRYARKGTDPHARLLGRLSRAQYPRVVDPPEGLIWTANARIVGGEMLARIGETGYSLGARQQQIRDALRERGAKGKLTEADMHAIQLDDRALFLAPWRIHLQGLLAQGDDALRARAKHHLDNSWTGRASVDSVGYRLVRELRRAIADEVMGTLTLPAKAIHPNYVYKERGEEGPLWELVTTEPAHLLHPAHSTWTAWQLAIIDRRLAALTEGASDPIAALDARTWGEANVPAIAHPLVRGLPPALLAAGERLGIVLAPKLDPLPGDNHMPRAQTERWGPSEHMAVSPGKEAQGYLAIPGGQSGHPLSPNYFDQYAAWASGERIPFQPGETQHTLTLVPAAE